MALVLGIVTLFTGGSEDPQNTAQPGETTSTSSEPTTSAEPPPSSEPPPSTTSEPPPATSTTTPPPSTQPSTPNQPPPGNPGPKATVRVLNNSTISHLASDAAEDLRRAGYAIGDVGNYSGGTIPVTTVYYRPGTDEEAPAKELAREFGVRAEPRFEGIKDAAPAIIMIVTREYKGGKGGAAK
ncbi:pyruvate/2-oxoglutarate dehydrogenase complex dihydrolipoamide acyltransferase (E2) component [Crossiella equi]|uniref:Pyruvate/2-oxoglutarate dehydrogenase complex dihydrolipoamide acyltransferase (E2) component n=1 Tax=Crossiella equi TaxID=130796 RepID=A0ABS5AFT5_9PSEU|nr:LytR C-terminal domain-containing protein [Crossiella equi]MBP2475074.1 pyruvate/2-oxoglutarate dehydrogenase complex dihydrolipoamide acyltransferase (E2) component [Crossiella equi]